MELNEFQGKKILILGLGKEGQDTLVFLLKYAPAGILEAADRVLFDNLPDTVKKIINKYKISGHFGKNYLKNLQNYDIIVKSPGIPIHLPEVEAAYKAGKITSQTNIFFNHCRGTIIGITGTKGKSTTSSLIYTVLKKAAKNVQLLGNIGQPVLSHLKNDNTEKFYVYELSAHQLYELNKSPHIAILTNLYQEHLDYYSDYNEYIQAKTNITIHQSKNDFFIYNSNLKECQNIAKITQAKKIAYNEFNWNFKKKLHLIGKFNLENAKIAAIVGKILKIDDKIINNALAGFKPLPHRLEFVGEYRGIKFYNDSLSTIQESAVAAIEGLGDNLQTLIAGGFERHQPFDKLARKILDSNIKTLILFLPTGKRIWQTVKNADLKKSKNLKINHYFVKTMAEAVDLAFTKTQKGKICLLSAASASFGGFRDYADRGDSFKKYIRRKNNYYSKK